MKTSCGGLSVAAFARGAAHVLAELNAIHAFREGNGRTQLAYLALLALQAGHPLAFERMNPAAMLSAMIASFKADEKPLAALFEELVKP
ncbi:MAG: Fic family protein [Azospirillaceae bacterium]|nr:Fic family protein [Azospirillaceae bacterium]